MNTRDHSYALKLLADDDKASPFNTLNDETYELAMSYCRMIKHAAQELAPLLNGLTLVVTPDGQARLADLKMVRLATVLPESKGNA